MFFENVIGDARGCRRGVERPGKVLARMTAADPDAVMREHFVVKRGDQRELLGERRRTRAFAAIEMTCELSGKPRLALCCATNHDRVGAGCSQRCCRIVEGADVPVDGERDRYALLDGADCHPVGAAVVELTAGAT